LFKVLCAQQQFLLTRFARIAFFSQGEGRGYAGREFRGTDWFMDIVHCPCCKSCEEILFIGLHRNDDDRDILEPFGRFNSAARFKTVHARQHDIHQDEIDLFRPLSSAIQAQHPKRGLSRIRNHQRSVACRAESGR
jgi:hypothetical protein